MYILNLFGDGIRYWICDPSSPEWAPLVIHKEKNQYSWEQVLFDLTFLKQQGFEHWNKLSPSPEQLGFILSSKNRIELKKGGKFLEKFRSVELYNDQTLFPRFQTKLIASTTSIKDPLVILQFETGLVGKYKFETESFKMDDLIFGVTQPFILEQELLLTEIIYNDQTISRSGEDTVVRGMRVIQRRDL